jgi:hypothetical protein
VEKVLNFIISLKTDSVKSQELFITPRGNLVNDNLHETLKKIKSDQSKKFLHILEEKQCFFFFFLFFFIIVLCVGDTISKVLSETPSNYDVENGLMSLGQEIYFEIIKNITEVEYLKNVFFFCIFI